MQQRLEGAGKTLKTLKISILREIIGSRGEGKGNNLLSSFYFFCSKLRDPLNYHFLFRNSSAVEQRTVNPLVVGSNPSSGEAGSYGESSNCLFLIKKYSTYGYS